MLQVGQFVGLQLSTADLTSVWYC